jgi:hypothetical protein
MDRAFFLSIGVQAFATLIFLAVELARPFRRDTAAHPWLLGGWCAVTSLCHTIRWYIRRWYRQQWPIA